MIFKIAYFICVDCEKEFEGPINKKRCYNCKKKIKRESDRLYNIKNRERLNEYRKNYYKLNPEQVEVNKIMREIENKIKIGMGIK